MAIETATAESRHGSTAAYVLDPCHTARRRGRARQARLALAYGLGGFLALQLVLILAIDNRALDLRDLPYAEKLARLRSRSEQAAPCPLTIVMLGSSRTVFGFKGGRLEQPLAHELGQPVVVFNFGMYGAGPVMNLVTLRRLLADGIRPDMLLIEVLPPLLTDKPGLLDVNRIAASQLRRSELRLVERFGQDQHHLRHDWWLAASVPCYSHRFTIVSRMVPGLLPWRLRLDWFGGIDDSGSIEPAAFLTAPERRAAALENARNEYAAYLTDFHLGGASCQALREQLDLCRQERIRAALVLMPEGTDFRSWYRPADWAQINQFLTQLGREFGVTVINAREWVADEDFVDSHHLLASGAAKYTDRLGREALSQLLREKFPPGRVAAR